MTLYFILPVKRTCLLKSKREFKVSILVVWEANRIFLNFQTCQTLFVSNLLSFILRVRGKLNSLKTRKISGLCDWESRQHQLQKSNLGNVFDLLYTLHVTFKKSCPRQKIPNSNCNYLWTVFAWKLEVLELSPVPGAPHCRQILF